MGPTKQEPKPTLNDAEVDEYLKLALSEANSWYKQADSKAQTILGFTGVYLSIVVGSVVLKREPIALMAGMPFRIGLAAGSGSVCSRYCFLCRRSLEPWNYAVPDLRHFLFWLRRKLRRPNNIFECGSGRVIRSCAEATGLGRGGVDIVAQYTA